MSVLDFEYKFKKGLTADEDRVRFLIAGIISATVILLIVASIALSPDPNTALKVIQEAGFSEGEVMESGFWTLRCSDSDSFYYLTQAKNPKGVQTRMTVCCGIFKDCTIRY